MSIYKSKLLDPGLCRCCKSIKKCRLLTDEYIWLGSKEIYSDMIMDCFGLVLSYLDGEATDRGVCATCVGRLRDACAFRKQVLQCEEAFLQAKLENDDDNKNIKIKVKPEPAEVSNDDLKDDDVAQDYHDDDEPPDDSNIDDHDNVNTESKSINKTVEKKKLSKKITKRKLVKKKIILKKLSTSKEIGQTSSILKIERKPILKTTLGSTPLKSQSLKDSIALDQQIFAEDNLIAIIENSYIYPFNNRSNNYYCFYCKEFFAKPEELRLHTWFHDPKTFKNLLVSKKYYYIDITKIDCRLCSQSIISIDEMKSHLTEVHDKKIHQNIPERFIQFRLTFTDLICCICHNSYFDFNAIVKHMVEHFSNFTCDVCGLCFLEESRLNVHMRSHKDEKKHPCEICGKIFKCKFYKDMHVDTVHNKIPTIRCPQCEEMFLTYSQKNKHLIDVHGMHKSFPCNMCDKVYDKCKTLTEHQRRSHLKVLKHRCEYCDQRFYLPSRLKEHMATHTGERNGYVMDI